MYDYYLNVEAPTDYAEFHYIFVFGENTTDYTYRKNAKQDLIYEKLCIDDQLLYEYNYKTNAGNLDGIRSLTPTLNLSMQDVDSILKYVISNTVLDDDHPLRQMQRYVNSMLWFRNLDENRYIGYKTKSNDYYDFIFEPAILKEFEQFLHAAGIAEGLTVNRDHDGKQRLYFDTATPLPFFRVASSGTKALYNFFYWYKTAKMCP